jgi:hypothetical protein
LNDDVLDALCNIVVSNFTTLLKWTPLLSLRDIGWKFPRDYHPQLNGLLSLTNLTF